MTIERPLHRNKDFSSPNPSALLMRRATLALRNPVLWWTIGVFAGLVLMAIFLTTSTRID